MASITNHRLLNKFLDMAGVVASIPVAPLAGLLSRLGPTRIPATYRVWDAMGVTPVRYHYYQPIPRIEDISKQAWQRDRLAGIDLNEGGQLSLLKQLNYQNELAVLPQDDKAGEVRYFYNNSNFGPGDAEIYYSIIRSFKPRRILEIGGGYSTSIAHLAVQANGNGTQHICVEPYEEPWLETLGLTQIIRSKVEDLPIELFASLRENDILFIDSSHVLRTGGDVWFEYLQILPSLNPGVLVHVHDVFLPYPYPKEWMTERRLYWTEQYLLQAVLQNNSSFEVLLALHFLSKEHHSELARVCPIYAAQPLRKPGSFWLRKR
jgi:predicted O-methyltransferase YrrM